MHKAKALLTISFVSLALVSCTQKVDFPADDAIVLGSEGAKKKVMVAFNPLCSLCQRLHPKLEEVVAERPDIAFYLFLYPFTDGKDYKISSYALCAETDREALRIIKSSADWGDYGIPEAACGNERVERHLALTRDKNGFPGTPVMVLPDGGKVYGAWDAKVLIALIDGKAEQRGNQVFFK